MIDLIQLPAPTKMLRPTAMNVRQMLALQDTYAAGTTVHAAAVAVVGLECRDVPVIVALANLATLLEQGATDVECAERYVAEAWAERAPAGVVFKG